MLINGLLMVYLLVMVCLFVDIVLLFIMLVVFNIGMFICWKKVFVGKRFKYEKRHLKINKKNKK